MSEPAVMSQPSGMSQHQKRLVYLGLAVSAVVLFGLGALYGYAHRHESICPNTHSTYLVAAGATASAAGDAKFGGVTQTKTLKNGAVETFYANGRIVERARADLPSGQQDDDMGQVTYLCSNGSTVTN